MIPAMKSFPTLAPLTIAYMSMGMEGGMIIPMVEEATVTPVENSRGYPFSIISGMRMLPMAEVSATEEPVMPPKIIEAMTLTSPSPPLNGLTKRSEKSMRRLVRPLWFISSPAIMKSGIAMMMKLLVPLQMRCGKERRKEGWLSSM